MVEHDVKRFIFSLDSELLDKPERIPISEEEFIVPGSPCMVSQSLLSSAYIWLEKTHGLRYAFLRYSTRGRRER